MVAKDRHRIVGASGSISRLDPGRHSGTEPGQLLSSRRCGCDVMTRIGRDKLGHRESVRVDEVVLVPEEGIYLELILMRRVFGACLEVGDLGAVHIDAEQIDASPQSK
ncbi:MAG: hypothetical protein IPG94_07470 [Kineosporiaceae bacterium]|nr:hypothetical protein [Kineosporiaceae bacterium]